MSKRIALIQHGTRAGYDDHRRLGEKPCDPCRIAWNELCREHQAASRARARAAGRKRTRTTYDITCADCLAPFKSASRDQRFCSHACRAFSIYKSSRQLVHVGPKIPTAPPAPVTIVGSPKWWRVLVAGPCAWCGEDFVGTGSTTIYCSKRCGKKATDARRGKRFIISPVTRRAIYERDGWTCQLCSEPIDRDAHYLDAWAPSLDHIVPQSHTLIPDHSPDNLRTAHMWCNSARGAGVNDQLFEEAS